MYQLCTAARTSMKGTMRDCSSTKLYSAALTPIHEVLPKSSAMTMPPSIMRQAARLKSLSTSLRSWLASIESRRK